jgi:ankyrin repeat protein
LKRIIALIQKDFKVATTFLLALISIFLFSCKEIKNYNQCENADTISPSDFNPIDFIEEIKKGNIKKVESFICAKADVNTELKRSRFLPNGAAFSYKEGKPLSISIKYDQVELVSFLLNAGAKIESDDVIICARNGLNEILKILISRGADIKKSDTHGITPLMYASQKGNIEIVKLLTDIINDKEELSKALLFAIKPNTNQSIPVGNIVVVRHLLEKGADANYKDEFDNTPIVYAAQQVDEEIVETLIKNGADPNVRGKKMSNVLDYENFTPLEHAKKQEYKHIEYKRKKNLKTSKKT